MGEPISLAKARKVRALAAARALASENRVRFGRTKAEKTVAAAETERAAKALDGAERED